MIGAHCKVLVGTVIESRQFYLPFEIQWLVKIGWMPGTTNCLLGGLL